MRAVILLGIICLAGCAGTPDPTPPSDASRVTGHVTLDGTPLTLGEVNLRSEDGKRVLLGVITETGEYTVPDVPRGSFLVCLTFSEFAGEGGVEVNPAGKQPPAGKKKGPPPPSDEPLLPELERSVPMAYKRFATSGLKVTVGEGETRFDIKLSRSKR